MSVRPPATPSMTETVRAMRTAPPEQREEFWTAIREAIVEQVVETGPECRPTSKPKPPSLVYYLRFSDRVKIGYTTNLAERLRVIPHDGVLATEVGTLADERARHEQFADLRVNREWFRYEEPLISHIANL